MIYLEEKTSIVSTLIENQFPKFVQENNQKFIEFLSSYYESQENKYQPLDIATNLVDYYNISYYRPNNLIEKTSLTQNVLTNDTSIPVSSTVGFPEKNGYVQIDSEIIFYRSKTATSFDECERGTTALILENIPKSEIFLRNSKKSEHKNHSDVINIAFSYANEFFTRIKSELAPLLPEILDESLDISAFIKNIKSFYSSKGSLNSHRILFKLIFNDKKFSIKLKPRGTGAKLKINNFSGFIPTDPKPDIVSGGVGYDSRTDTNNKLINPPVVEIYGSGSGSVNNSGLRPNKTAVVEVTEINSNGTITDINVVDTGEGYRGPIRAKVRPRNFKQDQKVYNVSGTGFGRVDYYDAFTNEVILYDVIGFFKPNEEIYALDDEKPRAFIAKSFTNPVLSRSGLEVISETQEIEFPKEYTFKTSDSKFNRKKVIRCKLLDGYELPNNRLESAVTLVQDSDELFGVPGTKVEVDNHVTITENIFEFEVSTNIQIDNLYLQPTSRITKNLIDISSTVNNFIVTVDDASRFPLTNGIIFVNGREISYKTRSVHQFFGCQYNGTDTFSIFVKDEVISIGRTKYDVYWSSGENIKVGDYRVYGDNLYVAETNGFSGSIPPIHLVGSELDGSFENGDQNPIRWKFYSSNRLDHFLKIDYNNQAIQNPRFQLLALPGNVTIDEPGALHSETAFKFAKFDSPNVDSYNFTTSDISNRLSLLLSTNYNRTRQSVTDGRLPSFGSLVGFSNSYDYADHLYIPSSGIPPWWQDIVNLNNSQLSVDESKKVSFTNQKLICRWKKSSLIYESQAVGTKTKTKKLLGLNIDAIQVNSYKGNTVEYGRIDKFFIGDGGNYPVPYTEVNGVATEFNLDNLPSFILKTNITEETSTNVNKFVRISSHITKINFSELFSAWSTNQNLSGFTSKPNIEVINLNPFNEVSFTNYNGIDLVNDLIISSNHQFQTLDKVKFYSNGPYFTSLTNGTEYYVRKNDNNSFSLHRTESDVLLNTKRVSVSYKTVIELSQVVPAIPDSSPGFRFWFITDIQNPIDFEPALLDLSYKNGNIDGILIRNSGKGYVTLPKIVISGGGKPNEIEVPFSLNGTRIIEMEGSLISYTNFYKQNYYEIDTFTTIPTEFEITPSVTVNNGSGAKAAAYVSNGRISSIVLINSGSSYSVPPIVKVTGNGKDAVVESRINSNGEVIGFIIINSGTGYTIAPRIDITPVGTNATMSCKLKEWTFNLVRQLNKYDRIDSYGGYVYDDNDSIPTTHNPSNFKLIDYNLDFPKDLDKKQYYLLQNSDKLLSKYTEEKNPIFVEQLKQSILQLDPSRDFLTNPLTESEIFSMPVHSPAIVVSYDGVPIYGGKNVLKERNKSIVIDPSNPLFYTQWTEIKSRYKLKYTEVSSTTSGAIELNTTSGNKYVVLSRDGGPSIEDYPIGSFIEDYEYVPGTDNDLDVHNGRFSITPEFPNGRYCYFTTTSSFDPITNALVESSVADNDSIGFNGFPYFIGDTFASIYDDYMNGRCRTNDKIPKHFVRSFEKDIAPAPLIGFTGLDHNDEYPAEDDRLISSVATTKSISSGSVDSIIIENKGDGYRVGDRLDVDNTLTSGSGFSAIVSRVGGKNISYITKSSDYKEVEFFTDVDHSLKIGDYIYFDYKKSSGFTDINLHGNVNGVNVDSRVVQLSDLEVSSRSEVGFYNNKQIFAINLNSNFVYKLNIFANSEFLITYDIDKVNEFFTLEESPADSIIITAENIPGKLYLHIQNYIYELNKTSDYFGVHRVATVNNQTKSFTVKFAESTEFYETNNLVYSAKSYGPTGPIEEVSISNTGFNYKKLPVIRGIIKQGTADQVAGDGKAIIQANSNSIGKLKNVEYSSICSFDSNQNVNHYLNVPTTAKIINNFEIYDVEVISGGNFYDNVVEILVDGSNTKATLRATVNIGTITNVEVIDGGSNFTEIPTLTVSSQEGSGAILSAKIRRKQLYPGNQLIGTNNPSEIIEKLYPVQVKTTILNFDSDTSTIEFDEISGQFNENDIVYTLDGQVYGRIVSIRRSRAYSKVSSYANLTSGRNDIVGNVSESLQKITDSNYYQDWSYSLVSSRDTKEWKSDQNINTHPAGFKQFGKKVIERRKFFFDNPAEVFKSSVIFTTNIVNTLKLKVKLTPCNKQKIFFQDTSVFNIGDYVYGTISEAIGEVVEIGEYFVTIRTVNDKVFVVNDIIVGISPEFAFGVLTGTYKYLAFYNGIFQEPELSYEVSTSDPTYSSIPDTFIPKFDVSQDDEVVITGLTTEFVTLDSQDITAGQNNFGLTYNQLPYNVDTNDIEQFIISIGGSIQNPDNLSVVNNKIYLNESISHTSRIFAIKHNNIRKLTFTGSGSTYTIDQVPTSACNLLIFYSGSNQSQLLTDFTLNGNIIQFEEPVDNNIFGWFIDETAECEVIDPNNLNKNKCLVILPCVTKNFSTHIESNTVKSPKSFYEIRKEKLDGTLYASGSSNIVGFDSKFTYTSPRFSTSYVEVLDRISFNSSSKTFTLTSNGGELYVPSNNKESLVVYIDNVILDPDLYSVNSSTITFVQTYSQNTNCTIIDYVSKFSSNTNDENGSILDRLNVVQNSFRKTFNLSNRGVPRYVNNVGDLFVIKNGLLKAPSTSYIDHRNIELYSHSVNDNKITFVDAPSSSEENKITFFNRQLLPESSKNVILDRLRCFDGVRTVFPITIDGILFSPVTVYHLFVVRNGVMQVPGTDYTISGSYLTFTTAPQPHEIVFSFYSYDGLNQNLKIDTFKKFDGIHTDFALTYNYVSSYVDNDFDIMVYRNGVYQHPSTDYTIINKQTGPYIRFYTAPVPEDDIYILNFNPFNNDDLIEITSRFTQVNQYTIAYTSQSTDIDRDVFLIYLNGILQVNGSWVYNNISGEITFAEQVDLSSNKVTIFAFANKKRNIEPIISKSLDSFKIFDGVQTKFALTLNYIETDVLDEVNLQVYRNGVYQYPTIDYTISDVVNDEFNEFIVGQNTAKIIEFTTAPEENDKIFINNITTDDIVDVTDRFDQLASNSLEYTDDLQNPVDTTVFLIYRNGTLQDSTTWSYVSNVLTFTENISVLTDNLKIYAFVTTKKIFDQINILKLDDFVYFDSQSTDFSITYNYLNDTVIAQEYLHVFRNGVYQYEGSDYNVVNVSGSNVISFTTAPLPSDEIFTINYDTTDLLDVTSRFTQLTQNTLQYTENISSPVDKSLFLIYLNGILQVGSWSYDSNTDILTLDENVTIGSDQIKIFGFSSPKIITDTFTIQNNVSSYPLLVNGVAVTSGSLPLSETDVVVSIAGVLQEPGKTYVINGQNIEITYTDSLLGSSVTVYILGQNYDVRVLDSFDDDFVKKTFKLQNNFKSFDIFGINNLYVYKNGQVLTPSIDYVSGDGYITFTNFITESDDIEIYVREYILYQNGIPTSSSYTNSQDLIINVNGVVQQPEVVYTVSSNFITLTNPKTLYGYPLNIYEIGSNNVERIDYLNDDFTKNTFKLSSNYVYYNVADSGEIFVFKNGELLAKNVDFTFGNGYITFINSIIETDDLFIGTYNYNLIDQATNSIITTNLPGDDVDLLVNINGVCQKPGTSYTVNGSTITLLNATDLVNPENYSIEPVYIYQVGTASDDIIMIDYLDDNYSKSTYKLQVDYKSFNPPNSDDIFIIRNGVVQNPVEDFVAGNGFITFTTNITELDEIFILYTHGSEELSIANSSQISSTVHRYTLSSSLTGDYNDVVIYADGAPRFYRRGDFTVTGGGTELNLTHTEDITPTQVFIMRYINVTLIDDYDDCPNGSRTRFKLLYNDQNLVVSNTVSDADILISINGVVQHPGVQYTLTPNRGFVDMSYAPQTNDEIFMIRMLGNEVRNLTTTGIQNQYTINIPETNEKENIVVFSNNTWKFAELGDFTWNNDSTITLSATHTTGNLFAIKFYGIFDLLDQINTPYNGSIKTYNMFDLEENFVPVGTINNDNVADETSILITKNGKMLDPKVDYTLIGDIKSQINFTTAPISSDVISVRTVGSFDKLDTISNGSGQIFEMTKNSVPYYPNFDIDRPRKLENQILVLLDGVPQSPLYDYFVYQNLLIFEQTVSFSKMVILDFRGTSEDTKVYNRFYQVSVGDQISLSGETSTRKVTEVLSPTLLRTEAYTGLGPSGFDGNTTIQGGKITTITVTNPGIRYRDPVVIRTVGTGIGAKVVAYTNQYAGGVIESGEVVYSGHNVYNDHILIPTVYGFVDKEQPLSKSQVRKGTKLTSDINAAVEIIPLANTFEMPSNTPTINVSSSSGSGASFKVFISNGELRKLEIINGGIGYDDRDIKVELIGGGGSGCVLEPVLDAIGTITDVIIRNPGVGYDTFRVIIHNETLNNTVNSEVIEYTYVTPTGIDGCTRGVVGTASSHTQNDIVYFDSYL